MAKIGARARQPPAAFIFLKHRLRAIPGFRTLVRWIRLAVNSRYRSQWRLRQRRPQGHFQNSTFTLENRYPSIFRFVSDHLAATDRPRLLSFGCSTGEEVFALRRHFPKAEIVGIDLNPWAIDVCRKRHIKAGGDPRIRFELAGNLDGFTDAAFDAVFCMAMLRHGDLGVPGVTRCDPLLHWADFQSTLNEIDRCLAPGGYLSIMHSNFRFKDSATATRYDVAFSVNRPPNAKKAPLFGPDNLRLDEQYYNEAVFHKRRHDTDG